MSPKKSRIPISYGILVILLCVLLAANLFAGSISLPPREVWLAFWHRGTNETVARILWDIRMPRTLAAVFLGGALSLSGLMLQNFFGNPIAGPFVLGISSGAKLVVALTMIATLERGLYLNSFGMILAAFVGSMLSMGFILAIAGKVRQMHVLIICGVMIGYICSAITEFVVTFADDSNIVNLHNWSQGSFSGISWENVQLIVVVVTVLLVVAFFLSKPMQAYQLGEDYAKNMGVPVRSFRIALILVSSILSACVTAFAGPIAFVGVAVPHLVKGLMKTSRPILVIPACFLGGGVFCLFCDLIARTVFAPTEVSISSVTAIFGAPVVIWLMLHRNRRRDV